MRVTAGPLEGIQVLELDIFRDERGFFMERFNARAMEQAGVPFTVAQVNHSRSLPRVIRGLHFQHTPPQAKIVGVSTGAIFDVVVDVRPKSKTFGRSYTLELNDENGKLIYIPAGFAHGFCVLGDRPADVVYLVDHVYQPGGESGIVYSDPELGISWPVTTPLVSARDKKLPTLAGLGPLLRDYA